MKISKILFFFFWFWYNLTDTIAVKEELFGSYFDILGSLDAIDTHVFVDILML